MDFKKNLHTNAHREVVLWDDEELHEYYLKSVDALQDLYAEGKKYGGYHTLCDVTCMITLGTAFITQAWIWFFVAGVAFVGIFFYRYKQGVIFEAMEITQSLQELYIEEKEKRRTSLGEDNA